MAGRELELGPTGHVVRSNVALLRKSKGMSYAEMARRLEGVGRSIPPLGLRRLEAGERRVDVDDLTAIAEVLEIEDPSALLRADLSPIVSESLQAVVNSEVATQLALLEEAESHARASTQDLRETEERVREVLREYRRIRAEVDQTIELAGAELKGFNLRRQVERSGEDDGDAP